MILDGSLVARCIYKELIEKIKIYRERPPCLAFLLVGDHPASKTYVAMKKKRCHEVGILSIDAILNNAATEHEILRVIKKWNEDPLIDGILVQLPLPSHITLSTILEAIDPAKDVDGFHPVNLGKLLMGRDDGFIPCTPLGIKVLLEKSKIAVEGKHVVIVGRGMTVGRPLATLLGQKKEGCNATVTVVHSYSEQRIEICQSADILIAAIGQAGYITPNMVKRGAVVIDVGNNRNALGQIVGDVAFDLVAPLCSSITPVPKGVGPMTIAMLLKNTVASYERRL